MGVASLPVSDTLSATERPHVPAPPSLGWPPRDSTGDMCLLRRSLSYTAGEVASPCPPGGAGVGAALESWGSGPIWHEQLEKLTMWLDYLRGLLYFSSA